MDTAGTGFQVNLYTNGGNNFHFNFIDPNKMVVASGKDIKKWPSESSAAQAVPC